MSVPLRLLGLLLTAVGLVVATTGLVLLVQPVGVDRQPAAQPDDGDGGDADAAEPDSRAARSPLPISASPGSAPSPPPTSPPRAGGTDEGEHAGSATRDVGARSPRVTAAAQSAGQRPSADAPAPARPLSDTSTPQPTAAPSSPPAPSGAPPADGVAPDDGDDERVQDWGRSCRHTWPWAGRRGSRGRGGGWGPPLPCDDRSVDAEARGSRSAGGR